MRLAIRELTYEDGPAAERLVRQRFHSKGRLSLSHAPNLFDFYRFLSGSDSAGVHFWGSFAETGELTGLTGFVNYELELSGNGIKCFYNSDSLVVPGLTGQGIYLKLLDQQTEFFNSREFIPLSWGIEHEPGKLEGLKIYLEKTGGMEVRFLGHTLGFNVLLSRPPERKVKAGQHQKIRLRDLSAAGRKDFLQNISNFRQGSLFYPKVNDSHFGKILQLDPEAVILQSPDAGLIAVNMSQVRRYVKTSDDAPMESRHWSMFWSKSRDEETLKDLFAAAHEEALSEGVAVAVVRDIPLSIAKLFPEVLLEPRRLFAVNRKSDHKYFQGLEQKAQRIELDALFV